MTKEDFCQKHCLKDVRTIPQELINEFRKEFNYEDDVKDRWVERDIKEASSNFYTREDDGRKSIYVATHKYTELTKVGMSKNPEKRARQLDTASGGKMIVHYQTKLMSNAREMEQNVLEHFSDKRKMGEWINESPEIIEEYIKTQENKFRDVRNRRLLEEFDINVPAIKIQGLGYLSAPYFLHNGEFKKVQDSIYYHTGTTKYYMAYTYKGITKSVEVLLLSTARNILKVLKRQNIDTTTEIDKVLS